MATSLAVWLLHKRWHCCATKQDPAHTQPLIRAPLPAEPPTLFACATEATLIASAAEASVHDLPSDSLHCDFASLEEGSQCPGAPCSYDDGQCGDATGGADAAEGAGVVQGHCQEAERGSGESIILLLPDAAPPMRKVPSYYIPLLPC